MIPKSELKQDGDSEAGVCRRTLRFCMIFSLHLAIRMRGVFYF